MTINEFTKKYYMHDSYFEKIDFNKESKTVIMHINFPYWMQDWYHKDDPENGLLVLTFHNVVLYDFSGEALDISTMGIINVKSDNDIITFSLDDLDDNYYELRISTSSVDVEEQF